jgi:hypothetical protein
MLRRLLPTAGVLVLAAASLGEGRAMAHTFVNVPICASQPRYVLPSPPAVALAIEPVYPGYYTPPVVYRTYEVPHGAPPACTRARVRIGGVWRIAQICF